MEEEIFFGVLKDSINRVDKVYQLLHAESVISLVSEDEKLIKLRGIHKGEFFMKWADFEAEFETVVVVNCSSEYFHDSVEVPPPDDPTKRVFTAGMMVRHTASGVLSVCCAENDFKGRITVLVYYEIERNKF